MEEASVISQSQYSTRSDCEDDSSLELGGLLSLSQCTRALSSHKLQGSNFSYIKFASFVSEDKWRSKFRLFWAVLLTFSTCDNFRSFYLTASMSNSCGLPLFFFLLWESSAASDLIEPVHITLLLKCLSYLICSGLFFFLLCLTSFFGTPLMRFFFFRTILI